MIEEFIKEPFYAKLGKRQDGFRKIIEHLSQCDDGFIIETGTARIRDNWDGDGQSTLIWDWFLDRQSDYLIDFSAYSIDISQEYIDIAKKQTQHVHYLCEDSIKALNDPTMATTLINTRLLYLDSFDWSPQDHLESSFHHMCEFASVWRLLPKGCLIVIDDRHSQFQGKHVMVQYFFDKLGIKPAFEGYQIGWIK